MKVAFNCLSPLLPGARDLAFVCVRAQGRCYQLSYAAAMKVGESFNPRGHFERSMPIAHLFPGLVVNLARVST